MPAPFRRKRMEFNPRLVPGLVFWGAADCLSGNDGVAVEWFYDLSGSANHFTQATGTNQPLFKRGAINGLPALQFDGSNDSMSAPSALIPSGGTFGVFMVLRITSEAAVGGVLSQWANSQANSFQMLSNSLDTGAANNGTFNPLINGTTDGAGNAGVLNEFAYTTVSLISIINDGTTEGFKSFLNGVVQDSGTRNSVYTAVPTSLGARSTSFYDGYVGELLIYNQAVTEGGRQYIDRALMTKWRPR